jgi:TolB-like protein
MNKLFIAACTLFALALSGCSSQGAYRQVQDDDIISKVERATKKLMRDADYISDSHRIIVTSFANVDNLTASSRFGRIVSQMVAGELTDRGYTVVEVLMAENLRIDSEQGEFLLSRDVTQLGQRHNAEAVVVGTYAEGVNQIYVTAKLVRASDAVVLSAYSFEISMGPDARQMIR